MLLAYGKQLASCFKQTSAKRTYIFFTQFCNNKKNHMKLSENWTYLMLLFYAREMWIMY
jgi:hypothetical protein